MEFKKLFGEGYERDTDFAIKKELKLISNILNKKFMIGLKYRMEDMISIGAIYMWVEGGDGSMYYIEDPQFDVEREKLKKIAFANETDPYPQIKQLLIKYRKEVVNEFKKL